MSTEQTVGDQMDDEAGRPPRPPAPPAPSDGGAARRADAQRRTAGSNGAEPAGARHPPAGGLRAIAADPLRLGGLALVTVAALVLNVHKLAQNGYANIFYSAGVKSMLRSFHNFFFVSFDPGGLVTID
ncbi:MAG TPA: hypothetical protein VH025_06630, partial [Solirubrobacteraceae bacterium]|nr:hypothetical protein [Solirubrobacteraceae bacterium]